MCGMLPLLLLALLAAGCGKKTAAPAADSEIRVVKVGAVRPTEHDFQKKIRVQGTVMPVEEADIASRTDGNLNSLPVGEGSVVKKGDVLFQVDRKNLENSVAVAEQELAVARDSAQTAQADLEIARIKYEKAQLDFKRSGQLIEAKAISTDSYETCQVRIKTAAAEVKKYESMLSYSRTRVQQQQIQLEIARKNLEDSRELAPFDGIVTAKYKEQGEYVNRGTAIVHLENPAQFEISCMVSAVYHPQVVAGRTRGRVLFDGHELCSTVVSYRADSIDPLSRTFELKFAVPREVKIISGVLCDIDMILEERRGAGIPADAVMLRKGGEYQAYVVRDGKAEAVDVKPGITSGGFTELTGGEALRNDFFIVSGQYFLNAGDPVEIQSDVSDAR